MFHHEITAAAARERQRSWLAAAEQTRRAQLARRTAADAGRRVILRDWSEVLIRPVRASDAPLLADGLSRLSVRSRWMRFLGARKELSPSELRYLTEIDHHDHEALGALDQARGQGVGIARYVRDAADPQAAEIAVTVVDDWQRLGLGTVLLTQLSDRARAAGILRLTALVASENDAGIRLLRRMNAEFVRREADTVEYEIALRPRRRSLAPSGRGGAAGGGIPGPASPGRPRPPRPAAPA
jgi:RimJ/RimL family protein N-acetyltransferase